MVFHDSCPGIIEAAGTASILTYIFKIRNQKHAAPAPRVHKLRKSINAVPGKLCRKSPGKKQAGPEIFLCLLSLIL
jgi:hypothetical protein